MRRLLSELTELVYRVDNYSTTEVKNGYGGLLAFLLLRYFKSTLRIGVIGRRESWYFRKK